MKFYVVRHEDGEPIGCELSLKAAKKLGAEYTRDTYVVSRLTVTLPPREAMRLMLSGHGGYAEDLVEVFTRPALDEVTP